MDNRFGLAVVVALCGASSASITGFTGPVELISPPSFVSPGTSYANFIGNATVWDEQQNFLTSGVNVDMLNNPGSSNAPVPGSVGGLLDSHFFHFRQLTGVPITGTISFSGQIVGVAYTTATLNGSDGVAAPGGTLYDTTFTRGIVTPTENISINGNVLHFDIVGFPAPNMDTAQFRVFTVPVPAPGSLALLGAGGVLASRRRRRTA